MGSGVAIALTEAGFQVYATGRSIASADLPSGVHKITCDHLDDAHTAAAFERLANGLDILVNSAWGRIRANDGTGAVHVGAAVLGTAAAPLDKHAGCRGSGGLCRVIAGRQNNGPAVACQLGVQEVDGKQPVPLTLETA